MRRFLNRSQVRWMTMLTGGTVFVLSGCEPNVRDTVLAGVETAAGNLAATFIAAFFQTLEEPEEVATTVKILITDALPQIFA